MAGQAQISTRTIVRVFFTLVVLVVLLYVLYLVRSVVGLVCIARAGEFAPFIIGN